MDPWEPRSLPSKDEYRFGVRRGRHQAPTRFVTVAALLGSMFLVACSGGTRQCNLADPNSCGSGQRCAPAAGGGGVCEPIRSCDPNNAMSCPGGYVCRPSAMGPVCEPTFTAGRIPSCLDPNGIDVFAVEGNATLSVTWNVHGPADFAGGFRVRYGTRPRMYEGTVMVGRDVREAIITPLANGTMYHIAVESLGAGGTATFTSCEAVATPHVLVFQPDVRANAATAGMQIHPALASNLEGSRLYLAWDSAGAIVFAVSTDFGTTWPQAMPVATGSGQHDPDIAVREVVREGDRIVVPETVFVTWEAGGRIILARFLPDTGRFEAPVDVSAGQNPSIAVGPQTIHLAFERDGKIYHTGSLDQGRTFLEPAVVSGTTMEARGPSIAVNDLTGDVYIAWDARLGRGDWDIFFAGSLDAGRTFQPAARIDDDPMGNNQQNVTLAVAELSQRIYATWEDRRGGANVYFTFSENWGMTWTRNIDVGAGFQGDQFRPRTVVDAAHNVYVAFQDTSNGQRVLFSRFNTMGTFDPPLQPSRAAGMGGVVADYPAVATDRYGAVYVAWQENRNGPDIDIFFARAE
jgi:hypothetical protein